MTSLLTASYHSLRAKSPIGDLLPGLRPSTSTALITILIWSVAQCVPPTKYTRSIDRAQQSAHGSRKSDGKAAGTIRGVRELPTEEYFRVIVGYGCIERVTITRILTIYSSGTGVTINWEFESAAVQKGKEEAESAKDMAGHVAWQLF
ncbi:Protein CBG25506 [Caenorhabditis briggsae]|uniref:Protein CBG25506 n=1 Tax=Caenorhabditis briggsae TaxID=6238 RepID=B6IEP6_CAEBR|nr:Protein CBG25506 [Caenorhabditis briggsae]CAR98376.1 Protein CBG25506 [Caenorhabditis briggsae]